MTSTRFICLIAGFAATWIAPATLAQQSPLGDGTGLQKNNQGLQRSTSGLQRDLQVPGTGTPAPGTTRDFAAEVRFRNSIVTGNVGGGAAFRGRVGYTDPMDFRGKLGSDDLFTFKRDSLFSGAAGMGVRGTDALQYQFALSTGNTASSPSSLAGSTLALGRGTAEMAFTTTNLNTAEMRRTESNMVGGAMRSSSAYAAQRSLRPSFIGFRSPGSGEYERLVASPTFGLQFQPWDVPSEMMPEAAKEPAANSATQQRLLSTPFSRAVDRLAKSPIATREPVANSASTPGAIPAAKPAFDPAITPGTDPALNPASPTDSLSILQKRLFSLRKSLTGSDGKSTDGVTNTDKLTPDDMRSLRVPDRATSLVDRVGDLSIPLPPVADKYLEHMSKGQEMVKTGRYFDAEERFALALAAHPGDLPALIGRLHAQIAGGLTVSAASNLRRVITEHPEAVGITYSDELMGGAARAQVVRETLRANLTNNSIVSESALVLAYLGYQQGDAGQADVVLGLDRLAKSIVDRKAAGADVGTIQSEEAFLELIRGVWQKQ